MARPYRKHKWCRGCHRITPHDDRSEAFGKGTLECIICGLRRIDGHMPRGRDGDPVGPQRIVRANAKSEPMPSAEMPENWRQRGIDIKLGAAVRRVVHLVVKLLQEGNRAGGIDV